MREPFGTITSPRPAASIDASACRHLFFCFVLFFLHAASLCAIFWFGQWTHVLFVYSNHENEMTGAGAQSRVATS